MKRGGNKNNEKSRHSNRMKNREAKEKEREMNPEGLREKEERQK